MIHLFLLSCSSPTPSPGTLFLTDLPPVSIDLPAGETRARGRWLPVPLKKNGNLLRGPLPFRDVKGHQPNSRPPNGMALKAPFDRYKYANRLEPGSWKAVEEQLLISPLPKHENVKRALATYAPSLKAEKSRDPSNIEDRTAFAIRPMGHELFSSDGVFLPTDGKARWKIELPTDARLWTEVYALEPEVRRGPPTIDAEAVARVLVRGSVVAEDKCTPKTGKPCILKVDAADYSGWPAEIELVTTSAKDERQDVFFANPTLYTPKEDPRRVLLLFADTFRADRLGSMGAERKTAKLDQLGARGAVFTQARSVSSWTLPSVRSARSGRQPEEWNEAVSMAEHFRAHGWHTAGFVNNVFTSEHDDIGKGFHDYRYDFLARANSQVDHALDLVRKIDDRDLLIGVQFMDTHLPYREPEPFFSMFTDPKNAPYRSHFNRTVLEKLEDPVAQAYVKDRYDQAVQFLDASIDPLLKQVGDDDIVVFFSDHGEEFWEHGNIEHGHAVWEEVVRVPLIIAAPGLEPAKVDAPVSLLDLAPTLFELAGLPAVDGLDGASLVPLARGEEQALTAFRDRPQLIGRTLRYGSAWALLEHDHKVNAQDGHFDAYSLATDPDETDATPLDAAQRAEKRALMSDLYGRPFVEALSLRGDARHLRAAGATLTIELDGEVAGAWKGQRTPRASIKTEGNRVTVVARRALPGELYVLPKDGIAAIGEASVTLTAGEQTWKTKWEPGKPGSIGEGSLRLDLQIDQIVAPGGVEIPTTIGGLEDQLEVLGYAE